MPTSLLRYCAVLVSFLAASVRAQVPAIRTLGDPIAATPRDSLMSAVIARVLSDGRVIMNDSPRKRYVMFDSSLSTMRILLAAATSGAEYPAGGAAMYPYLGDTTIISDLAALSFLYMDPSGKVTRIAAHPRPKDVGVLHPVTGGVAFDAAGRMYFRGAIPVIPATPGTPARYADSAPIIRVNVETRSADTLAWLRATTPPRQTAAVDADGVRRVQFFPQVFDTGDDWGLLSDGTIAIIRAGNYHVDWIQPDGTRASSGPVKWQWVRLDEDRKAAIVDSLTRMSAKSDSTAMNNARVNNPNARMIRQTVVPTTAELPDYFPAIVPQAARPDRMGRLWVREYTPATTSPERERLVYDVIDRKGNIADRIQLPEGRTISGFGLDGSVYLTAKMGAGVVVERYRY
jgi:hypothetical protein